jgi:hypothetical protein
MMINNKRNNQRKLKERGRSTTLEVALGKKMISQMIQKKTLNRRRRRLSS